MNGLNGSVVDYYSSYWRRLELRKQAGVARARKLRWYPDAGLNGVEREIFRAIRHARRVLDFGAGDLTLKRKFRAAGFSGEYLTLDISPEHRHDFRDLSEVDSVVDAILCLEVIEHMDLAAFQPLMRRFSALLAPGGQVVLSTPNPACIISMWAKDAGHIQQYPLHDLVTHFVADGFSVSAYRVIYGPPVRSLHRAARYFAQRVLCNILAVDYAEGLMVIARKGPADQPHD